MFSNEVKSMIAEKIHQILVDIDDPEMPNHGPINFLLHVDGESINSWANIRNNANAGKPAPQILCRNETAYYD